MSEEQLSALLAKLKDDAGLQEKFKSAGDLDAAMTLAQEAGYDVSKADLLKFQAKQTLELSDEDLEDVAGGINWWRATCTVASKIVEVTLSPRKEGGCGWL